LVVLADDFAEDLAEVLAGFFSAFFELADFASGLVFSLLSMGFRLAGRFGI